MAKKVIYFTAGAVPTVEELAAIAALTARSGAALELAIRNASESQNIGIGVEACDYLSGTRPTAYANTTTYPATPSSLGISNGTTSAVVIQGTPVTGVTMTGTAGAGKSAAFTIVNGVITTIAFT